jgi:hypothetical protein
VSNSSPLSHDSRPMTAPNAKDYRPTRAAVPVNSAPSVQRPSTANPTMRSVSMPTNLSQARPQTSDPKLGMKSSSPAAQQLAAISEKNPAKGMKSRLRRAFSFSSSSELRKASAENNMIAEQTKLRREQLNTDQEDQDAVIAAQQEASGLGQSIYTHQGEIAASTDNISISSTASSASIMLRKMGRGVKKSTRNLRNLFRPKSMIGGESLTGSNGATAEVSLVTVEAERERVNVNVDPHDKPGGGTGYPKLENNSVDLLDRPASSNDGSNEIRSRKSIVGGDRERSEVLAAVRKGILKRKRNPRYRFKKC